MKFELLIFGLVVVSTHVLLSSAELSVGTYADPGHPGQCVMQQLVLPPGGVAKHPDKCGKMTCHQNSKGSVVTCPEMVPPPGCKVGEPVKPEASYPNCCRKKIICENGVTFTS